MQNSEANPFAMLNRDFPKFCRPPVAAPVTKYPDLLSVRLKLFSLGLFPHTRKKKSTEQLNNFLLFNHEANRQNMEAICKYHSGEAKKEDIHTLDAIK